MAVVVQRMDLWEYVTLMLWRNSFAFTWTILSPWRWKQYTPLKRRNLCYTVWMSFNS